MSENDPVWRTAYGGTGTIVVSRVPGGRRDMLRRYNVLVDGVVVGRIGRGKTIRCEVPIGAHWVQMKIDWCESQALPAMVNPGAETAFACAPGGGPSGALTAISVGSDQYISLWPVAGQQGPAYPTPGLYN